MSSFAAFNFSTICRKGNDAGRTVFEVFTAAQTMAFKLDEKTLEPANGDYIAFLKEIERGNAKIQGLTVTTSDETPGMVAVRRKSDLQKARDVLDPRRFVLSSTALSIIGGAAVAVLGLVFIMSGILDPEQQDLIPIGMFVTFGGLVFSLSSRQRLERQKRRQQTDSSTTQNNS